VIARQRVEDPASVSNEELSAAWAAAGAAAWAAQLACLSQLLMEAA
jgi:hypothetical protein